MVDYNGDENQPGLLAWRRKLFLQFEKHRTGVRWKLPVPEIPLLGLGPPPKVVLPDVWQHAYPYFRKDQAEVNIDQYTDVGDVPNKSRDAFQRLQAVKRYFAEDYPRLGYTKCLGWGGNGMAVAFHIANKYNEIERGIVAKMIFQQSPGLLDREINVFQKAEHITQLLYIDGEGLVQEGAKPPEEHKDVVNQDADGDQPMSGSDGDPGPKRPKIYTFMMEMLDGGDLAQMISRVREREQNFPNPILWRLCLCLVRMCIALAYPPLSVDEANRDRAGSIRESVPQPFQEPKRWIHFDFDPKNIFVGDNREDGEHSLVPIMKLGDFGLAREVEQGKGDLYYEHLRQYAKLYFFAPEQFCVDWDYIPRGRNLISTHPIAGNFGPHTNVWALGCTMECLITKAYPAWPPHPTLTRRSPPPGKQEYYTYAGHLEQDEYAHVHPRIIDLVFRCQAHLPEDRPSLEELERTVLFMVEDYEGDYRLEQELGDFMWGAIYEPMGPARGQPTAMLNVWREMVGNGPVNQLPGAPPLPHAGQVGPVQLPPEEEEQGIDLLELGARPRRERHADFGLSPQRPQLLPVLDRFLPRPPPPLQRPPIIPPDLGQQARRPSDPSGGQDDFSGIPFRAAKRSRPRLFGQQSPAEPRGRPPPPPPRGGIFSREPPADRGGGPQPRLLRPDTPRPGTMPPAPAGGQQQASQQGDRLPVLPGDFNPLGFGQGPIQWGSAQGSGRRGSQHTNLRFDPYRRPGSASGQRSASQQRGQQSRPQPRDPLHAHLENLTNRFNQGSGQAAQQGGQQAVGQQVDRLLPPLGNLNPFGQGSGPAAQQGGQQAVGQQGGQQQEAQQAAQPRDPLHVHLENLTNRFNQGSVQWGSARGPSRRGGRRVNRRFDPYRRPDNRRPDNQSPDNQEPRE